MREKAFPVSVRLVNAQETGSRGLEQIEKEWPSLLLPSLHKIKYETFCADRLKKRLQGDGDVSIVAPLLEFESQHLTVRLDENVLRIDLKGSLKNDIEEALENKPILREAIGGIFGLFIPLHIRLTEIESVGVNETGRTQICLPHRREILIPLEGKDSEKLVDKLNELVPQAKKVKWERIVAKRRLILQKRARRRPHGRPLPPSSYDTMSWYFPTEQVDNVPKLRPRRKKKRPVR